MLASSYSIYIFCIVLTNCSTVCSLPSDGCSQDMDSLTVPRLEEDAPPSTHACSELRTSCACSQTSEPNSTPRYCTAIYIVLWSIYCKCILCIHCALHSVVCVLCTMHCVLCSAYRGYHYRCSHLQLGFTIYVCSKACGVLHCIWYVSKRFQQTAPLRH